ncbi:MAG: hypothetical protein WDZ94_02940 [Patescibacteria group bacterium]
MAITKLHFISMLGLAVFGFLVLLVSLVATNRSVVGQVTPLSTVQFYTNGPILPDHPLYPVLMVRDRLALLQAEGDATILLQVKYADERRQRAMLLLKKGQPELAVSTFSKSQKYLLEASRLAIGTPAPVEMRQELAEILAESLLHIEVISDSTGDLHHSALTQVAADTRVVQDELAASVSNNY